MSNFKKGTVFKCINKLREHSRKDGDCWDLKVGDTFRSSEDGLNPVNNGHQYGGGWVDYMEEVGFEPDPEIDEEWEEILRGLNG